MQQVQRGHAVHQSMVQLGVSREASVLQSFDDMGLPQRAMPVEQAAVQSRGQLKEFANPSGCGQGRPAHVVLQIDVVIK